MVPQNHHGKGHPDLARVPEQGCGQETPIGQTALRDDTHHPYRLQHCADILTAQSLLALKPEIGANPANIFAYDRTTSAVNRKPY
jgi:hypothetical protein